MRSHRGVATALLAVSALTAAGCGGGERQDKNEKSGTFDVAVVDAKFPTKQSLAKQTEMQITVRNAGQETIPVVAVTLGETGPDGQVKGLTQRSAQTGLADSSRPVWIVDEAPKGGETAYVGTWALGALPAGQTRTFTWKLTAVVPGAHTVKYTVAAGLDGKAKAQLASGGVPSGTFDVNVSGKPAASRVDPDTGKVIRDDDEG
jgi:hypothetical protein